MVRFCSSLRLLELSGNDLTSLPAKIRKLKKLKVHTATLSLSYFATYFSRRSHLNLQELFVEDNRLRELPAKFGKLKKLEFLELGGNQLTGRS